MEISVGVPSAVWASGRPLGPAVLSSVVGEGGFLLPSVTTWMTLQEKSVEDILCRI